MDYWEMTITEAFQDAGIKATKEQIDCVTSWVEGAHENYGMANGYDVIPNPMESEITRINEAHKKEIAYMQEQIDCYRISVARRRNVSINDVHLENGEVIYG